MLDECHQHHRMIAEMHRPMWRDRVLCQCLFGRFWGWWALSVALQAASTSSLQLYCSYLYVYALYYCTYYEGRSRIKDKKIHFARHISVVLIIRQVENEQTLTSNLARLLHCGIRAKTYYVFFANTLTIVIWHAHALTCVCSVGWSLSVRYPPSHFAFFTSCDEAHRSCTTPNWSLTVINILLIAQTRCCSFCYYYLFHTV